MSTEMTSLMFSDSGRVAAAVCEEISSVRRAQKRLAIPAHLPRDEYVSLYILARNYPDTAVRLRLSVNDVELPSVVASESTRMEWRRVDFPSTFLHDGVNEFQFWTDSFAMASWALGIEGNYPDPQSWVSSDSGRSWRNEGMGLYHSMRGEYVVRVRLHAAGRGDAPPPFVWETPELPQMHQLRTLIPGRIAGYSETLRRARELASWVSTLFPYSNAGDVYAPWDPWTIIEWGRARGGHNGGRPITMCVHYAVLFTACCTALHINSRNIVVIGEMGKGNGHFLSEVWVPETSSWALVDPNFDLMFRDGEGYLSIRQVSQMGNLAGVIETGPATEGLCRRNAQLGVFLEEFIRTGKCFEQWAIWNRNDYLSHPELSGGNGHGQNAYCETDIVWSTSSGPKADIGMFPYHEDDERLGTPPSVVYHASI